MIHGGNVWQGGDPAGWLDYSASIRPDPTPEWVKTVVLEATDRLSFYPDPSMKQARRALAAFLRVPEAVVKPTAGGISAIHLAAHIGNAGALQFVPCFSEYAAFSANTGKKVENISLLTGWHSIGEPAELAESMLHEGCLVWLCNPLNPVGCAFSAEQIGRLLALVEEKRGWLAVDEAFIAYCPDHSVVSWVKDHERLLVAGSMTKILGIPGVRLGYLCAQPQVLEQIGKYQLTWELSCFAQAVASALPGHRNEIRADSEANARRRESLTRELVELGVYVYPSSASFVLADFGRPVALLAEHLRKKGILVRECMDFDGVDDGCHLRLAVKDESSNQRLLEALREAMLCGENR